MPRGNPFGLRHVPVILYLFLRLLSALILHSLPTGRRDCSRRTAAMGNQTKPGGIRIFSSFRQGLEEARRRRCFRGCRLQVEVREEGLMCFFFFSPLFHVRAPACFTKVQVDALFVSPGVAFNFGSRGVVWQQADGLRLPPCDLLRVLQKRPPLRRGPSSKGSPSLPSHHPPPNPPEDLSTGRRR